MENYNGICRKKSERAQKKRHNTQVQKKFLNLDNIFACIKFKK